MQGGILHQEAMILHTVLTATFPEPITDGSGTTHILIENWLLAQCQAP